MPGINGAITSATRALLAQQAAMQVVSDNIANANNPDYARRRGELASGPMLFDGNNSFGTGVDLQRVQTLRDPFVEGQLQRTGAESLRYEQTDQHLKLIEASLAELGDGGLSNALDNFWASWQDLAADPTSSGARAVVQQAGLGLVSRVRSLHSNLTEQITNINRQVEDRIGKLNGLLQELGRLNVQQVNRVQPGEVDDLRAHVMDELSKLTGATFRQQSDGSITAMIGNVPVVEAGNVRTLTIQKDSIGRPFIGGFGDNGVVPVIDSGEIAGLNEARDDHLLPLRDKLDALVKTIVTEVNKIHSSGFNLNGGTGIDFFKSSTTGMIDFDLSDGIKRDHRLIAGSLDGNGADNQIALAISDLSTAKIASNGTETISQAYSTLVSEIGLGIQNLTMMKDAADSSYQQMQAWHDSVSGVSVDEEMTKMMRYQNGFNAAAKLTKTLNEMMDAMLGIV